jgi:alpha-tubulin suppressor-like RCC1 family protein
VVALGAAAGLAGCSSRTDDDDLVGNLDDGGFDATFEDASVDGGSDFGQNDGGGATLDAQPFTGLRCAVSPCAIALAAGGSHVCALLSDQTVRCWGQNVSGELGAGVVDAGVVAPSRSPLPLPVTPLTNVTQIAAGGYGSGFGTSCAAGAEGGLMCWGSNAIGGLGLARDGGAPSQSLVPLPLDVASVTDLALGGFFGCALTSDGGVSCWGDDSENELGRALDAGSFDPTPTRVALPSAATAVATGKYHACVVLQDHAVACWGSADHGEIGQVFDGGVALPQPVPGVEATQITAGEVSTCAVTTAGAIVCWGSNQAGQLGRGDADAAVVDPQAQPVALPPLASGATALQIASAVGSTCALLSDRTVWCWGDNAYGELGTGSAVPGFSARPAPVTGLANVVQIAAGPGAWTVCALLQDGSVRCWGLNDADQLGVDTSGDSGPDESPHPVPVRVNF